MLIVGPFQLNYSILLYSTLSYPKNLLGQNRLQMEKKSKLIPAATTILAEGVSRSAWDFRA